GQSLAKPQPASDSSGNTSSHEASTAKPAAAPQQPVERSVESTSDSERPAAAGRGPSAPYGSAPYGSALYGSGDVPPIVAPQAAAGGFAPGAFSSPMFFSEAPLPTFPPAAPVAADYHSALTQELD